MQNDGDGSDAVVGGGSIIVFFGVVLKQFQYPKICAPHKQEKTSGGGSVCRLVARLDGGVDEPLATRRFLLMVGLCCSRFVCFCDFTNLGRV